MLRFPPVFRYSSGSAAFSTAFERRERAPIYQNLYQTALMESRAQRNCMYSCAKCDILFVCPKIMAWDCWAVSLSRPGQALSTANAHHFMTLKYQDLFRSFAM